VNLNRYGIGKGVRGVERPSDDCQNGLNLMGGIGSSSDFNNRARFGCPVRAVLTCRASLMHWALRDAGRTPAGTRHVTRMCNHSYAYLGRREEPPKRLDTVCPKCSFRHRHRLGHPYAKSGKRTTIWVHRFPHDVELQLLVDDAARRNSSAALGHGFVRATELDRRGYLPQTLPDSGTEQ